MENSLKLGWPWILFISVSVLIAGILYIYTTSILTVVIVALPIVILILKDPKWGVAIAISMQSWDQILNPSEETGYENISAGRIVTVISILSYIIYLIRRKARLQSPNRAITIFIVFILWCFVSLIWTPNPLRAVLEIVKLTIQLCFLYVGIELFQNRRAVIQLFGVIVVFTLTSSVYTTFVESEIVREDSAGRLLLQTIGINSLAIQFGFGILSAIAYLVLGKSKRMKIVTLFCIVAIAVGTMKTGTRAVFIGIPLSLIGAAIITYKRNKKSYLMRTALILVVLSGAYLFATERGIVKEEVSERLMSTMDNDIYTSNIRIELLRQGMIYYLNNPLGSGIGAEEVAYTKSTQNESHNTFLSVLIQVNIVGLLIFIGVFIVEGITILRIKDNAWRFVAVAMMIFLLIQMLKGSLLVARVFWFPLLLISIITEAKNTTEEKIERNQCI